MQAAQKAGTAPYVGQFDPFADIKAGAASLPTYLQRPGTQHAAAAPTVEAARMSVAAACKYMRQELGDAYDPGTYKARHSWCPISVRVHLIKQPDGDRHLHDHPWNARSIILSGGYVEQRPGARFFVRRPGDTVALKFGEYHRITNVRDGGALTLFVTGRYRGQWGFWVDGAKVPWREYERQ